MLGYRVRLLPLLLALACAGGSPTEEAAVARERLEPCPSSPNCVSTLAEPADAQHHIAPLTFEGEVEPARERLKDIVLELPRTTLVEEDDGYLRFTFRTALFRFVDDVEFRFEPDTGTVHFRSASRVGRSDLGVNRKRMERIREAWIRSR